MEKKYISLDEFCQRYSVGKTKAYELARTICPPVHVNGRKLKPIRFDVEAMDKLFYTPSAGEVSIVSSSSLKTEKQQEEVVLTAPIKERLYVCRPIR